MEHAAALVDGLEVPRSALPDAVIGLVPGVRLALQGPSPGRPLTLAEAERRHIEAVLDLVGGNRSRAAEILGVAPSTLWRRLKPRRARSR